MNVLIIEDEPLAAERLTELLHQYDNRIRVMERLDSVEDSVQWLRANPAPDLILLDIHLSDGLSFSIFSHVNVRCPIIFTTAYDQYAIQAFRVNSVDYLLKPVSYDNLVQALQKWQTLSVEYPPSSAPAELPVDWQKLAELVQQARPSYKTRFLIRFGDHIQYKNTSDIAYFYAEGKTVYLVAAENRRFIVDYTLEELEELLDPQKFFRLNRKIITQIHSVRDVKAYLGGRLKVLLLPAIEVEAIVSRERVADFKAWLDDGSKK